ncbi:Fic family protein [Microbacterium esteraromaticum]|uniref:Fic family protein n=1 Tax=Microbacterium esteraromaticum TaxID=57043 RepID=UPI0019D33145|nr:Fic family protein [Microbacterium esteraromaticum]MBN7794637.1 Fic family protein [Microbacterium esteraromaticum]
MSRELSPPGVSEEHPASGWPAIAMESRPWKIAEAGAPRPVASRRQLRLAAGDYQAAVPPFIADLSVQLSAEVLAAADDASAELARFDAEVGLIAAPFASILLRSESASSSEVENLTSSAKQVALAELRASTSGNARLVVANVRAMRAALELADDINEDAIIAMQHALLGESAPHVTGTFRTQQVWIGGGGISPHTASFVPPHHERVPALMADLVDFSQRTDVPLLAHAAITHAQFETIHPFSDGNGRTGRALLHSMLRHGGLTRNVTVPVSAGLLQDTEHYFAALTAYRAGDPEAIVSAVTTAAFAAVDNGRRLVDELNDIATRWEAEIPSRRGSASARLRELLLRHPVVNARLVAQELSVSDVAAATAIDRMVNGGALVKTNNYKRNRIWHAPDVLAALDRFGARARCRVL